MIKPESLDLNPVNLGTPDPQSQTSENFWTLLRWRKFTPLHCSDHFIFSLSRSTVMVPDDADTFQVQLCMLPSIKRCLGDVKIFILVFSSGFKIRFMGQLHPSQDVFFVDSIVSVIFGVVLCFSCKVNICLIRFILEFIVGVHKHLYRNPRISNELLELQLR